MKKKLIAAAMPVVIIWFGLVVTALGDQDSRRFIAVSAKEAADLLDEHDGDDKFAILDIRTPGEFQSSHLAKSIPIDFYSPTFADQLNRLDKTKTYLVYCRTGNRSTKSLQIFKKLKFQKVYHMTFGISDWKYKGFAVVK
jgi:rhodanese-related sulfurtransferase